MSYTVINFKTKKLLIAAVKQFNDKERNESGFLYPAIRCYQPGLGPDLSNYTGNVSLEGPHYPAAHTWYAVGTMKNGVLVKVK